MMTYKEAFSACQTTDDLKTEFQKLRWNTKTWDDMKLLEMAFADRLRELKDGENRNRDI